MPIQVGDALPHATLHEDNPRHHVDTAELFAHGRSVIIGVPGAFTPTCSNAHLPGYVERADDLHGKGIDRIACVSVNDAYVMREWGKAQGVEGKVRMLADPNAEFTKALGLDVYAASLGGIRSKRYAMVVEDGRVTRLEIEPDGFALTNSAASALLDVL